MSRFRKKLRETRLSLERIEDRLTPVGGFFDPSFGSGGFATVPGGLIDSVNQIYTEADGSMLLVGQAKVGVAANKNPINDIAVVKLNPSGAFDPTFGTGGRVLLSSGVTQPDGTPVYDSANRVAELADGRLTFIVSSSGYALGYTPVTVFRLTPGGSPDPTFDGDGKASAQLSLNLKPADNAYVYYSPPTVQSDVDADGRVTLGIGTNATGTRNSNFFPFAPGADSPYSKGTQGAIDILRLGVDGRPDSTFARGGELIYQPVTNVPPDQGSVNVALYSLNALPDGGLLYSYTTSTTLFDATNNPNYSASGNVARLTAAGGLDPSFGTSGVATLYTTTNYSSGSVYVLGVQSTGKVVVEVFGATYTLSNSFPTQLVRLNGNGTPDSSYGDNGAVTIGYTSPPPVFYDLQTTGSYTYTPTGPAVLLSNDFVKSGSELIDPNGRVPGGVTARPPYESLTFPGGQSANTVTDQYGTGFAVALYPPAPFGNVSALPANSKVLVARFSLDSPSGSAAGHGAPVRQFAVGADAGGSSVVRVFNPDGSQRFAVNAFPGYTGGVRVATADFNGDGVADLVAGTGPGVPSRVVVYDGQTGAVLYSAQPFEATFTGGVNVAAGDVTGDGRADLVVSADHGGGGRVLVVSGDGFTTVADFMGIDDAKFRGGTRVAVADIDGDGTDDILVAAGAGGGPRLAAFKGGTFADGVQKLMNDIFVFESTLRDGVYVSGGDLNGDGFGDVVTGAGPGGSPRVYALSGKDLLAGTTTQLANFMAGTESNRDGVRVTVKDLDGDNKLDVVTGSGSAAGPKVSGYLGKSLPEDGPPPEYFPFDPGAGLTSGAFVG